MELNISELDDEYSPVEFEPIPENIIPAKKSVRFQEPFKPLHPSIPRVNARMTRPQTAPVKPKISYEDILSKMGMFVMEGKLHLIEDQRPSQQKQQLQPMQPTYDNIPQDSYIYNKYFKDHIKSEPEERRPLSLVEYRNMLIQDHLQRQRIKQIKSTKLILPTANINLAAGRGNLNKLFNFSKR